MSHARTFLDHVHELRIRLFVSVLFFIAGGGIAYAVNVPILHVLQHPFNQTLYYTTPAGAFNLVMKISILGGVVLVLPALVYNIIAFVQPAMKKRLSKGELRFMTALSLVLAIGGALFAYIMIVPMSLKFFGSFNVAGFKSLISATDYVNFVVNCLLAFVIIFQLPLAMLFLDRIKPLPPKRLWKNEKFVVVGSLIVAVALPFTYDPATQFIIAVPIILLYNLSIFLILWSHRSRRHLDQPLFVPVGSLFTKPLELSIETVPIMSEAATEPMDVAASVELAQPVPRQIAVQSRAPARPPAVVSHRPIVASQARGHSGRRSAVPLRSATPISRRVAVTFTESEAVILQPQTMSEA